MCYCKYYANYDVQLQRDLQFCFQFFIWIFRIHNHQLSLVLEIK